MKKKAFTLIELLAVIVILAIILGITIVSITGVLKGAKSNSFEATQKVLKIAAKTLIGKHSNQCAQETHNVYICTSDLIKDNYIKKITNIEGSNDECVGYVKAIRGNSVLNEDYYTFKTYLKCGENEYTDGLIEDYNEIINYCNTTQENRYCTRGMEIFLTPIPEIDQVEVAISKILTVTYPTGSYVNEYSFDGINWVAANTYVLKLEFRSNGTLFVRIKNGDTILKSYTYEVSKVDSTPIGTVVVYAGEVIPEAYLLANGSAVSRTTYKTLFNKIGTTYGAGNGSSTFNLPNLSGRVVVGQNTSDTSFDVLGKTGGAKTHTLTAAEMPNHTHTFTGSTNTTSNTGGHNHSASNGGYFYTTRGFGTSTFPGWGPPGGSFGETTASGGIRRSGTTASAANHTHTVSVAGSNNSIGSGQSHSNLKPYLTLKEIIKYQ